MRFYLRTKRFPFHRHRNILHLFNNTSSVSNAQMVNLRTDESNHEQDPPVLLPPECDGCHVDRLTHGCKGKDVNVMHCFVREERPHNRMMCKAERPRQHADL